MSRISFVLGATLRDLRRTGGVGAGAIVVTGLAVVVIGGTALGLEALARLTAAWWSELRVVAVLRDDPPRPDRLLATVQAFPGVGDARYVTRAEALAELKQYLGPAGAGLDGLSPNPVPARLEVAPTHGLGAAGLAWLVTALGRLPGVEAVQAATGWVEPSERVARGLRTGGFALGGVLGLAATVAVAGAARLARWDRADETAIFRLSGVPEARVWGPVLLQSVTLGGAGAALGWSLLFLLSDTLAPWAGEWVRGSLGLGPLPTLSWSLTARLLAGGVAVGLVGGLSAGRP